MNSRRQTKTTMTVSLIAAGLLTVANAVALTSAANALASHSDGIQSSPTVTTTLQAKQLQVAAAEEENSKKKKKKKKRNGSYHGG